MARVRGIALLRQEVEDTIEKLIAFLDRLDGDADLEPSLGSSETISANARFSQTWWADAVASDDREDDGDDLEACWQDWQSPVPNWPPALYVRQWSPQYAPTYAPLATE